MCRIFGNDDDDELFNNDNESTEDELVDPDRLNPFSSSAPGDIVYKSKSGNFGKRCNGDKPWAVVASTGLDDAIKRGCLPFENCENIDTDYCIKKIDYDQVDEDILKQICQRLCKEFKIKDSTYPKKEVLQCLSYAPIRKEGEHKYDAQAMNMSDEDIKKVYGIDMQDILQSVHSLSLLDELKELHLTSFNDLYKTLDAVYIVPRREGKDYGWCEDTLGCYKRTNDSSDVYIFLDAIKKHHPEDIKKAVISTYIHELYHAYFNSFPTLEYDENGHPSIDSEIPQYLEEPIVESLTIATLHNMDKDLADWFEGVVQKKFKSDNARKYGLGAFGISIDIAKCYKYLKYLIETDKSPFSDYKAAINDTTKSSDECLERFKAIFEDNK